ncbi:hypothetical protein TWF481_007366 [Arthrobotrys musiformis]|uniref:F-box domain-containing protein n=1 Tax=Arthrobotrys musiformis TaxID=47236 RepID=A0AAV9WBH2_9PEZI
MQNLQNQESCEPELRGSGPSLLSLPEELIEQICQHVSSKRDVKSLDFLCRTSRDLNRIGTPVLYHSFPSQGYIRRIFLFLRTLCERPDLCTHVRWMSLAGDAWYTLTESDIALVSKAAERFGLDVVAPLPTRYPSSEEQSEDEEYVGSRGEDQPGPENDRESEDESGYVISDEDEDAEEEEDQSGDSAYQRSQLGEYPFETMAQLIIALTPNLRYLDVVARQIMCDAGEGSFTLLEELAGRSPPPISLPHLHDFSFGHDDFREVSFSYFEGVIALAPNIRKIWGDPCYDQPRFLPVGPINIKNVTDLRFKSGHLSEQALTTIVSSCERLEVFQYHYSTMYSGLDPICASPREIVNILSQHKDSLRELDIEIGSREEHQEGMYFGLCIEGEEIVSLKMFSCLETFKVDGSSILFPKADSDKYHTGVLTEMLPQSIRTLRIFDTQEEAAANLVALTDSLENFPHLSEIYLSGNTFGGPLGKFDVKFKELEVKTLRDRLKCRGIAFLKRGRWTYSSTLEEDYETREYW